MSTDSQSVLQKLFGLDGRVAVVTGGASRQTGDAWSLSFSARGAILWESAEPPNQPSEERFGDQASGSGRRSLLVDSEGPLAGQGDAARRDHLSQRGWNFDGTPVERVHLMVQSMETWIVADPDAVQRFYGQSFLANALSRRQNLEQEPKADLFRQLEHATRPTQKGRYHKIRHASGLLAVLDPSRIALRCPHFGVFTRWLDTAIAAA